MSKVRIDGLAYQQINVAHFAASMWSNKKYLAGHAMVSRELGPMTRCAAREMLGSCDHAMARSTLPRGLERFIWLCSRGGA